MYLTLSMYNILACYNLRVGPVPIAGEQVELHSFLTSVNFTLWSITRKNPGTQRAEGRVATELVWMFWRKVKSLASTGIRTADHEVYGVVAMPSPLTMLLQLIRSTHSSQT